jgi:hypothetical protein
VNIDASSIAQSPLLLGAGANLTVNLEAGSTNTLTAGGSYAGLQTASDTSLTIGGTGSLIAKSGWGSAGIGGNQTSSANQNSGGNITITGGNITATGSDNGAGIGSGACSNGTAGNNSGTIIIRGNATVVASSGSGAGIGAGSAGSGTYILICDGANVEATSNRGAGIGGGINSAPGGGGGGNILIYGENTQVVAEHSRIGSGGDFASSNILAMAGVVSQWGWTPNDPPYAQIGGNPVTFTASPASSGTVTVTLPAFFNTSPFAIAAGAPITLITGLDSTGKTLQMFADYSDEEFVFSLPGYPSVTKTGAELSAAGASVDFVANNPAPVPDPNPAPKPSRPNPSYDRSDDDSSYTPAPTPVEQWMSAANLRNPSRDTLRFGVRASVWDALTGKYYHDSLRNGVVEVRAYFDDPGLFTRDAYVSGWVSGTSVTSIRSLFEKYFSNKIRTIHFDQSGKWENPIKIAAKIDFAGIDTTKLVFYSYDSTTNSYRRLEAPAYRIDANGYLRFTTEYAGEIIISEGGLEKR